MCRYGMLQAVNKNGMMVVAKAAAAVAAGDYNCGLVQAYCVILLSAGDLPICHRVTVMINSSCHGLHMMDGFVSATSSWQLLNGTDKQWYFVCLN